MARYLCFLILFFSLGFAKSEGFILRYKVYSHNNMFGSEEMTISAIMSEKSKGYVKSSRCKIPNDLKEDETTINFLNRHKDELLECAIKDEMILESYSKLKDDEADIRTVIKKRPTYFTVKFNTNFAKIQLFDKI